ncbi:MAG: MBL fold metallo-hydrolase [Defluviitaleaceae bacterium]|nr:MBL fold metallo-hydrolase [Defluviitaleaceae bacterium]
MKPIRITGRHVMFSQPIVRWGFDLNMGLILGKHRNYLIDTGFGSNSVAPVLEYLAGDDKPIIAINTHACWDHVWGNHVFEKGLIIGHKIAQEMLAKHWGDVVAKNAEYVDGDVRKCPPNLTFEGEMHFADDGISIFHTPGHSPCSISIIDTVDKVLYAGDNIGDTMDKIIPEIYGDMNDFRATVDFWKKLDFEIAISGHNKPQTKAVIKNIEAELAKLEG